MKRVVDSSHQDVSDMGENKLFPSVHEADVVRFCQDLVRIKSVNPPGDELPAAQYVASTLKKAGLDVELVSHSSTRASVLARLRSDRKKPGLLLCGHLDTVPVGSGKWAHDPFQAEMAEGRIWGRGSVDMKGGLAALMAAAKALSEARVKLRGDLVITATAGEETDSLGATAIAARPDLGPLQAVVIPEPTYNDLYIAEKGALWLELSTQGRTAHGSMPDLGQNAIMMMVALINELKKLAIAFKEHPLLGGFTQSVNTITGGLKTNVVPDLCTVTVDMRTVPGQDHRAIVRQIEELIADLSRRVHGFEASVRVINDRIPIETSPEDPVVQSFAEVVAEVTGHRPIPKGVHYYTDAVAFVPALKIPMIICGPGDARLAHQPDESVEASKLIEAAKICAFAAARLLG
ncbi:MAG: M20 family metallopeptidase [Thermodesulfobacteriota bacterium]